MSQEEDEKVITYPGCIGICDGVLEFTISHQEKNILHMNMKRRAGIYDPEDEKICGIKRRKPRKRISYRIRKRGKKRRGHNWTRKKKTTATKNFFKKSSQ